MTLQRIGIDVGGTFTDFALLRSRVNGRDELLCEKVVTCRDDPGAALVAGIERLAKRCDVTGPSELLADTDLVIYSTTAAINALIQGSWAVTGLLCTAGFRDTIDFREGYKERRYMWDYPPPQPIVPRRLRLPVRERVAAGGTVVEPLDEEDVVRAVETFRAADVEAVAINFLWSFVNPSHEAAAARILRERMPNVPVVASSEIFPERREYPRESTTLLNAALAPVVRRHLDQVDARLRQLGFVGTLRCMQGNGGLASPEMLRRRPIFALNSGPAAAPVAARALLPGIKNIIVMDMGGTSCDLAAVVDGQVVMARNQDHLRRRIGPSMVQITTLGAGGGSIASVESGRLLRVGPRSAEAVPGPACYDLGGVEPTVTDANLVLGYLDPDSLLGGRMRLRLDLAEDAISRAVAEPLGVGLREAAFAIHDTANQAMTNAIWEETVRRGLDPREFTLVAAGGAGAVHACSVARELGIEKVVVPRFAGSFCAAGVITALHQHIHSRSLVDGGADATALRSALDELEEQGRADMTRDGVSRDSCVVTRRVFARYRGQVDDVVVPLLDGPVDDDAVAACVARFHDLHDSLFSFCDPLGDVEITGVEVVVASTRDARAILSYLDETADESDRRLTTRTCVFADGEAAVPVLAADDLADGAPRRGPAIVTEPFTTLLVPAGTDVVLDGNRAYVLRLDGLGPQPT